MPILKQINQLNDDGSYTFGFEAGDGSFRVETRDISGHIRGKYGYVDENGEKQVLGTSARSFAPDRSTDNCSSFAQSTSPERTRAERWASSRAELWPRSPS